MFKSHFLIIPILLLFFLIGLIETFAANDDRVICEIVESLNKANPEKRSAVKNLELKKDEVAKIFGWVKVESLEGKVKSQLYYLEWTYEGGEGEIILENYGTNPEYEVAAKVIDQSDYFWKNKRIFKAGIYRFKVYIKKDNKMVLAANPARLTVTVAEEGPQ